MAALQNSSLFMGKKLLWVLIAVTAFSIAVTATNQLKESQLSAGANRGSGQNVGTKIDNIATVSVPVSAPSFVFPILSLAAAIGVDRFLRHRKKRN